MTGRTNYTIYVPLGSSFSVNATYACTPPEEVELVIWELKLTNVSILAIVFLTPIPYTDFRSGIEATGTSSMCTLTVYNATMAYNGTLFARIQTRGRKMSVGEMHPQYFLKVNVIITGILISSMRFSPGLYVHH